MTHASRVQCNRAQCLCHWGLPRPACPQASARPSLHSGFAILSHAQKGDLALQDLDKVCPRPPALNTGRSAFAPPAAALGDVVVRLEVFAKYFVAAYGWPMYMYMHCCRWRCCGPLMCCCRPRLYQGFSEDTGAMRHSKHTRALMLTAGASQPPNQRLNSADFADLFCRFVGFVNSADLFYQFVGFL